MSRRKQRKPVRQAHIGCLSCSTVPRPDTEGVRLASMWMTIAVGFGAAYVTRDNECVYDEMEAERGGQDFWTVGDAERAAAADPEHDWRIVKHGPLHGETYQRQGPERWVMIESNPGFA